MNKPKIIAMYLPQFHSIPENDIFWGKGFTDWDTVKKSKPLITGHTQPKVPFKHNYYDLSLIKNVEWQCKIASEHGIYAFGVYHYWFNDKKNLLTKPAEILRDSDGIQIKYFFTWDNCSWVRSWSNVSGNDWSPNEDAKQDKSGPKILVEYILGSESNWKKHYDYVRSHLNSSNYMKIEGKPVFCIINYNAQIQKMCDYWNELAKEDGFLGIYFIFKYRLFTPYPKGLALYNYEPHFSAWGKVGYIKRIENALRRKLKLEKEIYIYDYDSVWESVLKNARINTKKNFYHGAFVGYDDSPRRGRNRSRIIIGGNPEKFAKYLSILLNISKTQNKEYIFLTAWNEWSEGAYLEPDEEYQLKYLEAMKKVLDVHEKNIQ